MLGAREKTVRCTVRKRSTFNRRCRKPQTPIGQIHYWSFTARLSFVQVRSKLGTMMWSKLRPYLHNGLVLDTGNDLIGCQVVRQSGGSLANGFTIIQISGVLFLNNRFY